MHRLASTSPDWQPVTEEDSRDRVFPQSPRLWNTCGAKLGSGDTAGRIFMTVSKDAVTGLRPLIGTWWGWTWRELAVLDVRKVSWVACHRLILPTCLISAHPGCKTKLVVSQSRVCVYIFFFRKVSFLQYEFCFFLFVFNLHCSLTAKSTILKSRLSAWPSSNRKRF